MIHNKSRARHHQKFFSCRNSLNFKAAEANFHWKACQSKILENLLDENIFQEKSYFLTSILNKRHLS